MNHFVIIAPFANVEMQNILTQHFVSKEYGYAHWSPESWLVVTNDDELDAQILRDSLIQALGTNKLSILVLRVQLPNNGVNWAYCGNLATESTWNEWLKQYWEQHNTLYGLSVPSFLS